MLQRLILKPYLYFIFIFLTGHSLLAQENPPKDSTNVNPKRKISIADSIPADAKPDLTKADSIIRISNPDSTTIAIPTDSSKYQSRKEKRANREHNPDQALLRSLLLPGLGQIYNRKYWKLPIVYGGLGGLTYGVVFYHREYKLYQRGFFCREHPSEDDCPSDDAFSTTTDSNLKRLRDQNRRMRDLFIIFTALGYTLTTLDAYIDAHLMSFDVSDDLSMRITPEILFSGNTQRITPGITVNFHLR